VDQARRFDRDATAARHGLVDRGRRRVLRVATEDGCGIRRRMTAGAPSPAGYGAARAVVVYSLRPLLAMSMKRWRKPRLRV
jgi:hypothetical protein